MFLGRYFLTFRLQLLQGADYAEAGVAGLYYVINVTFLGSLIGI